jgi:hypothetical protein
MGLVAAMAKENAELKARMLNAPEPEQKNDDAI